MKVALWLTFLLSFCVSIFFSLPVYGCDLQGREVEWSELGDQYRSVIEAGDAAGTVQVLSSMVAICPTAHWRMEYGKALRASGDLSGAEAEFVKVTEMAGEVGAEGVEAGLTDLKDQAWLALISIDKLRSDEALAAEREVLLQEAVERQKLDSELLNTKLNSEANLQLKELRRHRAEGREQFYRLMVTGFVGAGVGLAAATSGGVLVGFLGDKKDNMEKKYSEYSTSKSLDSKPFKDAYSTYRNHSVAGYSLLIGGSALLISGLVMGIVGYSGMSSMPGDAVLSFQGDGILLRY